MIKLPKKIDGNRIFLERPKYDIATAQEIFAHIEISRASMLPWLDWVDSVKSPQDRLMFLKYVNDCWEQGKEFSYSIRLKKNNIYAGHISVVNISLQDKSAEFGYWLSDNAVGNGYIQEAIKLLEIKLQQSGFKKLIIEVDEQNVRSLNVAKKLNYVQDTAKSRQKFSTVSKINRNILYFTKNIIF